MMKRLHAGVAVLALMAVMGAAPVRAQQTTTNSVDTAPDEIIVTAQKSGVQALQEVPLAIQAFSGEDLKERNINNIADLATAIPGISESQRQSVASRSFSIRGAGAGAANGDSAIGYYVDDVPFVVTNFGIAPPIRFLDLDRVEVLRGPQGTLYGQGSAGGVFIFHTRDPDLTEIKFAAEAQASQTRGAGGLNYGVAGVVSVPIIKDVLAVRVSGGHSYNPGWADEYYGAFDGTPDRKGVNEVRDDDIRVVALFRPVDNLNIRAQYWHFRPRQQFLGGLASTQPPYYANTAAQPSFGNGDFKLYSLSAGLDFDTFSISSATTYLKGNFGIYVPIAPAGAFSSQFFPDMFSQEVRINSTTDGPFHWLLGGAYQDGSGPQENYLRIPVAGIDTNADNNTITKNWAVYGELGYDLFDGKLRPRVGLRYYHDKRTFEDANTTNTNKKNVTTWRVNLSYVPNDDLTVFATAATGFRPGIVQSQIQADLLADVGIPAGTQTRPESSTNYEAGIKWRSPDRTLNVGLNFYINKLEDMLTPTPTLDANVSGFSNFGDGTSKGVDIEMRWRTPLDGLTLSAVANINQGKYDTVDPAVQARLPYLRPGTRLVNTLEENARVDATYETSLGGDLNGLFNVAWTYNGNRLQTNGEYVKAYSVYSANIGLRYKAYDLTLFGENLGDYDGAVLTLNTSSIRVTPRTIGVRLRVNYQ
ncbi:TonB-dependent receptor [Sphingobium sp. B8D3D]|uniref:TonB-dependent receptor n=2 Tax=unclassified Sphingobium TaxID=2611147 RepID=UPI0022240F8B|nr:TonB-dependent receptor [Sphingobium sp. B8D3D]MCW2414271.1 outer membrane receptor protein involved in Fe transport [Sphingobium sp. B8D3A]